MAYNASIPLNSDSPSIFPAQSQENFTRLQTIIEKDHQFNLSAATNDGYHNLIHQQIPNPLPTGALSSIGRDYVNTSAGRVHKFYMDDQGTFYQQSPTMPIRAAVNFNGTGAVGVQTLRSQYNVTSVTKVSNGVYVVAFDVATPMPDNNYIIQITGMRDTIGTYAFGMVSGDPTYNTNVQTGAVGITFVDQAGVPKDVIMGNVTIFSVT